MAVDTGILDQVTQEFLTVLHHDAEIIAVIAQRVFSYLVVIQLTLSALWMTLAGESLQRFVVKLVQLAFSFGFFYGLITYGGVWIPELLNGFIDIGQKMGLQSLDPSSIVSQGVSIAGGILKAFFNLGLLTHPFVAIVAAIVCVSIIIIYAFIAAELVIVLVKSYVLVATGGLFFAFGGSELTRVMAQRYFSSVMGLGLQLMSLYMLLAVGQRIGDTWTDMAMQASLHHQLMPLLVILCAVIVYYLIVKNVPPFIAGLSGVGGFRNHGETAVAMAMNVGASSVNAAAKARTISGKTVQGLTQFGLGNAHAIRQFGKGFGGSTKSPLGRVGAGVAHSVVGLGAATANTLKDMALKQHQHQSFGQKMNRHLANRLKPTPQGSSHEQNT